MDIWKWKGVWIQSFNVQELVYTTSMVLVNVHWCPLSCWVICVLGLWLYLARCIVWLVKFELGQAVPIFGRAFGLVLLLLVESFILPSYFDF